MPLWLECERVWQQTRRRRPWRHPREFGLAGFKPAVTEIRAFPNLLADTSSRRCVHRRACAALTNTMRSAVCAADAALMDLADAALCAP